MPSVAARIDTDLLRQQHPIVELVTRYGVELRRAGGHFSARCPFHADGGRPNLAVFPRSGRWVCFRCDARGDTISFVQQIEHVSFREAASRLGGSPAPRAVTRWNFGPRGHASRRRALVRTVDTEVLGAALELYSNRLPGERRALDYLAARGFGRELLERERIGFAAGGELVAYLAWRGVSAERARRAGLVDADGREVMQGQIVFRELRHGRPVWFIGRLLEASSELPGYLGLRGNKPLLGWDWASQDLRGACLVEGPTDWLALRMWGVPGLALCGTSTRPCTLSEIFGRWKRLYIVMDTDEAGLQATARLVEAFGPAAVPVRLADGVKDPADLAMRSDGGRLFAEAIREALARYSGVRPATV